MSDTPLKTRIETTYAALAKIRKLPPSPDRDAKLREVRRNLDALLYEEAQEERKNFEKSLTAPIDFGIKDIDDAKSFLDNIKNQQQ